MFWLGSCSRINVIISLLQLTELTELTNKVSWLTKVNDSQMAVVVR